MRPRYTKGSATRETAGDLLASGLSVNEVAARMGRTPRTIARAKRELGLAMDRGGDKRMDEAAKALVQAHLDDGASFTDIQRTTGWNPKTLTRHFPGRSWNKVQVGEYAATIRRYGAAL